MYSNETVRLPSVSPYFYKIKIVHCTMAITILWIPSKNTCHHRMNLATAVHCPCPRLSLLSPAVFCLYFSCFFFLILATPIITYILHYPNRIISNIYVSILVSFLSNITDMSDDTRIAGGSLCLCLLS